MARPNLKVVELPGPRNVPRPIRTVYYRGKDVVKKTSSAYAINTIGAITKHLRRNSYEADAVEVYDAANHDRLYLQVRMNVNGEIRTTFERPYNTKKDE